VSPKKFAKSRLRWWW
jgi:hypothetical protein